MALGACWLLGDLGQPCTDVCGVSGSPLDAAVTLGAGVSMEVVDAVSRRYGLNGYLTTDSLDRHCRHETDPNHPAFFAYFPESRAWDCLPGESVERLAVVYRASCACSHIYPPPAPAPQPPMAPFVFGQPMGVLAAAALTLIVCLGLACCAICTASLSRPGGGTKLLLDILDGRPFFGYGPGAAPDRVLMLRGPGGAGGGLTPRGGDLGFLPWSTWVHHLCCCCCCWPGLVRCWRTWQEEGLREEIAERHHALAERAARDSWFEEMRERYGCVGNNTSAETLSTVSGGYGGGSLASSPRVIEAYDRYEGGVTSPYRPAPLSAREAYRPRLGYQTAPRSSAMTPKSASARRSGPAYFPSGATDGAARYPSLSPRAYERAYDAAQTPGPAPGGYAGCGATPGGYAALASVRTRQRGTLKVHIKRAAGLKAADLNFRSDPYVVVRCPGKDGREEKRTRHLPRTLDPIWNETLEFTTCQLDELLRLGLHLRVMDKDWTNSDDPLGEITVLLDALRVQNYHEYSELLPDRGSVMFSVQWIPLADPGPADGSYGGGGGGGGRGTDLRGRNGIDYPRSCVTGGNLAASPRAYPHSLASHPPPGTDSSYITGARCGDGSITRPAGTGHGTLFVYLDRGTNLKPMDRNGYSDPYVKLTIDGQLQKSKIIKKSLDPQWRQDFSWAGTLRQLTAEPMRLQVWDSDTFTSDDNLGSASVDLSSLQPGEQRDLVVPLTDGRGTIYLVARWSEDGSHVHAIGPTISQPTDPVVGGGGGSGGNGGSIGGAALPEPNHPAEPPPLRSPLPGQATATRTPANAAPSTAARFGWQPPAGSIGSVLPPVTRATAASRGSRPTYASPRCSEML